MNLILIEPHELNGNLVSLADRRGQHIKKTLKSEIGDTLRVGIVNGRIGTGTVENISKKAVTLLIDLQGPQTARPTIDLILALPRPIMLKRVLAQASSLGVNQIFLTNANRVEKSFFAASILQEDNYREFLLQGLEQAMDTIVPKVHICKRFKPFIEDYLPGQTDCQVKLLAHPTTKCSLWEQTSPPITEKILLAIGPEGGWVDFEVDKFKECGFSTFSMGPRILRVDTVVPALLAQINLLRDFQIPDR